MPPTLDELRKAYETIADYYQAKGEAMGPRDKLKSLTKMRIQGDYFEKAYSARVSSRSVLLGR